MQLNHYADHASRSTVLALALILSACLSTYYTSVSAAPTWMLNRSTTSFDRYYVTDPQHINKIIPKSNKSGLAGTDGLPITGWFEYDFTTPRTGWYKLLVTGENNGGGVEYIIDPLTKGSAMGRLYLYVAGAGLPVEKVSNIWLSKGGHTLRIQRYYWTGLPAIRSFTIQESSSDVADSVRTEIVGLGAVFRANQCRSLRVYSGGRNLPDKLTVWVKNAANREIRSTSVVTIPKSENIFQQDIPIFCTQEGEYIITFGDWTGNPLSRDDMGEIYYSVIEANPVSHIGGEAKRTLIQEIDCAVASPDYSSGATRVVQKPFGSYRESGNVSWFGYQALDARQQATASGPSWFAYKLNVKHIQQPYIVEIDYPDDATRTYAIALREKNPLSYPVSSGIDSGGEFSLTNRLVTYSLIYWPRATETRIVFLPAREGSTAAASKIRVYQVGGDLPLLDVPSTGTRRFVNWYEEGANYLSIFGAPDESDHGFRVATERWAQAVAYMGGDTLSAAVNVYHFVLYPSAYNKVFSVPVGSDKLAQMLLISEKYSLGFLPELHPRADELAWPYVNSPDPKPNLLVSKDGTTSYYAADGKTRNVPPYYNPLHPVNQEWYIGMIGELADRYKNYPALLGVSLRLMQWQNPTLNNFQSLDWGYDDYTVALFQKDTGIIVPGKKNDPHRFRQRYDWLMANAKNAWISWRCQKIAQLYTRIRDRVRQARPDLKVYSSVFDAIPSEFGASWLREAGVDAQILSRIDGVVLINALHAYGRRYDDRTTQGSRDNLLDIQVVHSMMASNGGGKFLPYTRYFEAGEVVVPPEQLGFDAATKKTGMSVSVNPAGRHLLERYAVALAETDASLLGDGGNGYTLGQPVLREFLQEYRRLPAAQFIPRADARDPVAVWELARTVDYLFYAVNRERFPVNVQLKLKGVGQVRRLSNGQKMQTQNNLLNLQLQPYQLIAFTAPVGVNITAVTMQIPATDLDKVTSQVLWLESLSLETKNKQKTSKLSPSQRQIAQVAARHARTALNQNRVWRARTIMEHHELLPIYDLVGSYPPYLRDHAHDAKHHEE